MSRARKILIAGLVLVLGVGLAWPFRNTVPRFAPAAPVEVPGLPVREAVTLESPPAPPTEPAAERHVAATMTSTADGSERSSPPAIDLESHPALARDVPPSSNPFTTPQDAPIRSARPAYATTPTGAEDAAWPEEVIHVVQNGDTLEKLAQRYLKDEGRALELFDRNRDQLSNPHLLPIGAELRIPVPPQPDVD